MRKNLLLSLVTIIALSIIGCLTFMFMMKYEPTPSKSEVEDMVNTSNLVAFGDVEGSYLYTPRNYGYYNENSIYVVEKSLGEGEQYDAQYVVIKQAEEITANDTFIVERFKSNYTSPDRLKDVQVTSKHQLLVYKANEKVKEEWFFKVIYTYNDDKFLSFVSLKRDERYKFNFFTKGYEQFLNF